MRIKALTSFMHDSVFIASGTEVDVPESVGIYLIDQKAAQKVTGGKGVQDEITPDPLKVSEQAAKAVETLKAIEPKVEKDVKDSQGSEEPKHETKRKVKTNTEHRE